MSARDVLLYARERASSRSWSGRVSCTFAACRSRLLAVGAFSCSSTPGPEVRGSRGARVLVVWGPLMIGGGFYTITGEWNADVGSRPALRVGDHRHYLGKHIDKLEADRKRHPHPPRPVGEKAARYAVLGTMVLQYPRRIPRTHRLFHTDNAGRFPLALRLLQAHSPVYRRPRPATCPRSTAPTSGACGTSPSLSAQPPFGALFVLGLVVEVCSTPPLDLGFHPRRSTALKAERDVVRHPRSRHLTERGRVQTSKKEVSTPRRGRRRGPRRSLRSARPRRHEDGLAGVAALLAPEQRRAVTDTTFMSRSASRPGLCPDRSVDVGVVAPVVNFVIYMRQLQRLLCQLLVTLELPGRRR